MTEYSIDIKVEASIGDEPAEALLTVLNDLEYGSTVAFDESFYTAVCTVEASSPVGAASEACKRLRVAADKAGLPDGRVARLEVMTAEEVHRELERPTYPAVLGIAELAELLGVSRQRASQVARVAAFPKPFAELASRPIWLAPNVERFVQEWERRPGRPRKKKARA